MSERRSVQQFELDKAEWRIPAERMKMREQRIVLLSRQDVAILRELEPLTKRRIPPKPDAPRYVFPGVRGPSARAHFSVRAFSVTVRRSDPMRHSGAALRFRG